jgi:membrane protein implicated in regulation of membrane protease activity
MHLHFLIPLATCIASSYLFKNAVDEIADLSGAITVVSLVLSLILAPWQLQLLVLTFVVISTRRLLLQNETRTRLEANTQEQQDKL